MATNPRHPTLWTIGHSNLIIEEFMGLLKAHDIQAVADVRRFPGSRRHPHFNQAEFSRHLAQAHIDYVHFPELGGRRSPRADSPNTAWENEAFRGYADHMLSGEFRQGIVRLLQLGESRPAAILCAEALWWQCHRALIADYLKAMGATVLHILSENKTEEHPYTAPARLVGGKLAYTADTPMELPLR